MSIFKSGSSKKDKKSSVQLPDVIQKLRETETLLQKKQEFLENKIATELELAKKHSKSNKTLALQALKRKKRYETYLQQVDGTLATVELQRETLETSQADQLVVESMKMASQALKTAHKHLDVDEVHNIMDNLAEERDKAQEISDAISKPVGFHLDDVDEDDLMKELEEMEQEELDEKLLDLEMPSTSRDLPAVADPAKVSRKAKKVKPLVTDEDEEELAKMGSWAEG